MSVVVWDGKTLAADRQSTCNDMRVTANKIIQAEGMIFACTGQDQHFKPLVNWFLTGANPDDWPTFQNHEENWSRLIVVKVNGEIIEFENTPYPTFVIDPFMAWGSGRDFAMGALAMGADARKAVEIASMYSVTCGMGADARKAVEIASMYSVTCGMGVDAYDTLIAQAEQVGTIECAACRSPVPVYRGNEGFDHLCENRCKTQARFPFGSCGEY